MPQRRAEEGTGQRSGKRAESGGKSIKPPVSWIISGYVVSLYKILSWPVVTLFLLNDRNIHPAHGMTWRRKLMLSWRLFRITRSMKKIGTTYQAQLAMATKILAFPPKRTGVVVECGTWQGGSTACLSVICDYADRELIVYDSFQGLPKADPRDAFHGVGQHGVFAGSLEEVRETVRSYGVLERCTFREGWFEDTLPHHTEPIVTAFIDVDLQPSIHECVLYLWPHLVDKGYLFTDECLQLKHCALFWSESWWRKYFDREPPGLIGSGTGLAVGHFWVGPHPGTLTRPPGRPCQFSPSIGYTRKDFQAGWGFYPDDP